MQNRMILCRMLDLCRIILRVIVDLFRPSAALEAEILALRQQIIVLRRGRPAGTISGRRQDGSGLGLSPMSEGPRGTRHRSTQHRRSASRRFPLLLAMEIETSSRPANGPG
jgi:hypothetical protein